MKLFKVKGIVIKEIPYKENDKIITLMTDTLGKISCMAKGAKKTNSTLLAPCQLLVYSEFILYKGTSFYHINSAETIDTFYSLRVDYDKLQQAYEITKILNTLTYENQESDGTLSLFLNTLYVIAKKNMLQPYVSSIFKIKMLVLTGYGPSIAKCVNCNAPMINNSKENISYYYSYIMNNVICEECYKKIQVENPEKLKNGWYEKISKATFYALTYVIVSDIKKVFCFEIAPKALKEFQNLADRLYIEQIT